MSRPAAVRRRSADPRRVITTGRRLVTRAPPPLPLPRDRRGAGDASSPSSSSSSRTGARRGRDRRGHRRLLGRPDRRGPRLGSPRRRHPGSRPRPAGRGGRVAAVVVLFDSRSRARRRGLVVAFLLFESALAPLADALAIAGVADRDRDYPRSGYAPRSAFAVSSMPAASSTNGSGTARSRRLRDVRRGSSRASPRAARRDTPRPPPDAADPRASAGVTTGDALALPPGLPVVAPRDRPHPRRDPRRVHVPPAASRRSAAARRSALLAGGLARSPRSRRCSSPARSSRGSACAGSSPPAASSTPGCSRPGSWSTARPHRRDAVLTGFAFAGVVVASALTLGALLPTELQATGQALLQTVAFGVAAVIANLGGGIMYATAGPAPLFAVTAVAGRGGRVSDGGLPVPRARRTDPTEEPRSSRPTEVTRLSGCDAPLP